MALTKTAIVEAAQGILEEYGLADLSMRRVADSLGVQAGALYYHVPNKQTLLAEIADRILADLREVATLPEWAADLRRVLLGHRDGAELVVTTRAMGLGTVDPTGPARALVPAGPGDHVLRTFEHFVLGATLHDQTRAQLVGIGLLAGFDLEEADEAFRSGVDILTRGVGIFIAPVA
ncbi:TetR family transcriptional regulator [Tessaracoccus oleiagri]|uniref:Transcriptional regulator, TetR family n=1 Tax=Tessaracoccus oleiagri TaxID=686624 RepID=A0A1G9J4E8_9ACTN|nr:TetR family transcriptional regulator [Tessaracoccus oleiagri]SDL32211.1 transcriptional regulator, TetR family [Tessaracoccus oleiagri]